MYDIDDCVKCGCEFKFDWKSEEFYIFYDRVTNCECCGPEIDHTNYTEWETDKAGPVCDDCSRSSKYV